MLCNETMLADDQSRKVFCLDLSSTKDEFYGRHKDRDYAWTDQWLLSRETVFIFGKKLNKISKTLRSILVTKSLFFIVLVRKPCFPMHPVLPLDKIVLYDNHMGRKKFDSSARVMVQRLL